MTLCTSSASTQIVGSGRRTRTEVTLSRGLAFGLGLRSATGGMKSTAATILFSQGESADDKIRRIVAEAKNTKNIVVVTDDRDIQYAVGALGAKAIGVSQFLSKGESAGKRKPIAQKNTKQAKKVSLESEKYISKTDESKITSELGKIWLKPSRGSER